MIDLILVGLSGIAAVLASFYFGMNYQEAATNQNAIHIQTLPYSAEDEPEDVMSIMVNDDLSGLINTGKATVETWHSPGKTVITISME